jgi:hypothetical protein
MTTTTSSRIDEPSDLTGDDFDGNNNNNNNNNKSYNTDDNMSIISMTNLIAEDVCRLQNLRFDNIGPNTRRDDGRNENQNLIDMDVNVVDFRNNRNNKRRVQRTNINNPNEHGTRATETVRVFDESDDISEITPTGCVGFEARRRRQQRRARQNGDNITEPYSSHRLQKKPAEGPLGEFYESMAECIATPEDFREIRRTLTDEPAPSNLVEFDERSILKNPNQSLCERRNRSFDEIDNSNRQDRRNISRSNSYSSYTSYLGNRGAISGSVVSAPAAAAFKNNSDRYNQLVIGLSEDQIRGPTEREYRKFSPAWYKSKREVNRLRNNTQIIEPQPQDTKGGKRALYLKNQESVDEGCGNFNVEVAWKQSKQRKNSKGPAVESITIPPSKKEPEQRTPFFKKLLKRGKSKERKRQQERRHEATAVRTVAITAKDPTRWKPNKEQPVVDPCNDGGISSAADCIDLCNSETILVIVGAADPPSNQVRSRSTADPRSQRQTATTRKKAIPSNRRHEPVWRGEEDPDFHRPSLPKEITTRTPRSSSASDPLSRKKLLRCKQKTTDDMDLDDDDSGIAEVQWTRSRSYESDDYRQQDVKVLSIVGRHFSSHQRYDTFFDPPLSDGFERDFEQDLAQQPERQPRGTAVSRRERHPAVTKHTDRSSSTSYTTSSTTSSSATEFSSSSSSPGRPSRNVSPKNEQGSSLQSSSQTETDVTDAEFVAVFPDPEPDFGNVEGKGSTAVKSPWRNDFADFQSSKNAAAGVSSPRGIVTPPKAQRSTDPFVTPRGSLDQEELRPTRSRERLQRSPGQLAPPREPIISRHAKRSSDPFATPRGPITPPKVQRSSDPYAYFDSDNASYKRKQV